MTPAYFFISIFILIGILALNNIANSVIFTIDVFIYMLNLQKHHNLSDITDSFEVMKNFSDVKRLFIIKNIPDINIPCIFTLLYFIKFWVKGKSRHYCFSLFFDEANNENKIEQKFYQS